MGKIIFFSKDINSHIKNVYFEFHKNTFPKISDKGYMDVDLEGISLRIKWKSERKENINFFLRRVNCKIELSRVHIHDAKHK